MVYNNFHLEVESMKKLASLFLISIFIISVFIGCSNKNHLYIPDTSPYNFVNYENLDDISGIEQIPLDNKLS